MGLSEGTDGWVTTHGERRERITDRGKSACTGLSCPFDRESHRLPPDVTVHGRDTHSMRPPIHYFALRAQAPTSIGYIRLEGRDRASDPYAQRPLSRAVSPDVGACPGRRIGLRRLSCARYGSRSLAERDSDHRDLLAHGSNPRI